MPAMDRKDKPKVVAEKSKQAPQEKTPAAAPQGRKIEVQLPVLSLDMGPNFVMKLVLMGLLALIFVFALILFTKTNFSTADAVDFARLQYNLPKLWGLWFIVFIIVLSLAIALSVLHGFGSSRLQAGFPMVFLFLISAVAGVMFPSFSLAFYGFAICVGIASIAASFQKELNLHTIWGVTSKALFALLVLSLIFGYVKFSSSKEVYFNQMLGSVSSAVPDLLNSSASSLGQQAIEMCADAIEAVPVTRASVEGALSKEDVARAAENTNNALYTGLPNSTKEAIVNAMYESALNQSVELATQLKSNMAASMRKIDVGAQVNNASVSAKLTPDEIRKTMDKIPAFKQVQDAFPFIAAMTVMSLVTIVNFFVHIFSTIFAWALNKVI